MVVFWHVVGMSDFARRYTIEPQLFDADTSCAANLMIQAMSSFGAKGGIGDSSFKSEAAVGCVRDMTCG
jgi:hypothetical protein